MKAKELKRALTYVSDDADVEFVVSNDGPDYVAVPVEATVITDWEIPKRGELTSLDDDDVSQTMTILLEAVKVKGDLS